MPAADASPETALTLARAIAACVAAYAVVGLGVAAVFVARGLGRVDRAAEHGPWGFRLLILPASAALWPWILRSWRRADGEAPSERNAHRDVSRSALGAAARASSSREVAR